MTRRRSVCQEGDMDPWLAIAGCRCGVIESVGNGAYIAFVSWEDC